jgi:hypothetical protein
MRNEREAHALMSTRVEQYDHNPSPRAFARSAPRSNKRADPFWIAFWLVLVVMVTSVALGTHRSVAVSSQLVPQRAPAAASAPDAAARFP